MTELSAHGVDVELPTGWEGRIFKRPAHGEVAASAAEGAPAPVGEQTYTIVHLATIPLPTDVGDFASNAVDKLGANDAMIVLFEYAPASAQDPLFKAEGMPVELDPDDFSPGVLQRQLPNQAGLQTFFHEGGRAFCLYVILGGYTKRQQVVPLVNQVLATLAIDGTTTVNAVPRTLFDVIAEASDLTVLRGLVDAAPTVRTLLSGFVVRSLFAPTDAAFASVDVTALRADPVRLERTLLHHLVDGRWERDELVSGLALAALDATTLTVNLDGSQLRVDLAVVGSSEPDAENGIVHRIDRVLTS